MARLKDEKRRTLSSRTWLERQLADPYVARAKKEGFRSRAAYKLIEVDDKYHLLKQASRVVDLGAAPGGWSEIAARRIGPSGRVIALDILDFKPMTGVEFLKLDFLDETAPDEYETAELMLTYGVTESLDSIVSMFDAAVHAIYEAP